ncbi:MULTISPECIES: nicotinate-nucleotide adenylyltransferase [unclassified Treponema]|uniref:nicotinate-nucleotide adenylyltransferase n=1 Tax=unclassified Treponema TaxID=2638727 RepID=UPI0020A2967C|nr:MULTISPECIES: nicotinate-nucleotide adenylyltransferase [unclassified Treponema]UTC67923.1 nicotinate-nucleotide adenylyltransferase [Treponema sp. OMZ 789]UTC70644.1 nicotinate-nucleotide adenylyltransferase [Treponema sp. OMZ 790]UTC73368.1 nicotinate-nucleotide adenylyltransferase [Treponema sp. OMZ 791]
MRLAILGGSFNPIHLGHLNLAFYSHKELAYDKIAIVPAYISPFKIFCNDTQVEDRLKMIDLAIADKPYMYCELYEIERKGVSYTIDTIGYLYQKFPDIEGKIGLIIGDDLKENFFRWKDAEEIIKKTDIIIGKRTGVNGSFNLSDIEPEKASIKELNNEILNISSTQIRDAVLKNEDFSSLVPKPVYDYIIKHGLYKKKEIPVSDIKSSISKLINAADIQAKIREIDSFAKSVLNESRYAHSVRVAEYARHLAEEYKTEGVPPALAYFTGLAHDICKKCSDEELVKLVESDNLGIDDIEKTRLNLLHGRAAAVVLQKKFGINDKSVLKAAAFHTFGYEGIDALGKIVYIADKIEPGRPNTENFREMVKSSSLNELMLAVLNWNLSFIEKKSARVHPETKKMYEQIQKELKK